MPPGTLQDGSRSSVLSEKALHEFYRTLLEEGIGDLVGDPSGFPCCGVQMSA